jgi:ABC-type nitrate/sulfonate/bicarbonate transport system permease component
MIIDNLIYYPAEFFRQLPAVAVIPFAIVIFGIYTPMKIAVAVFGCFFPIFVATREGLKSVEPGLMITARTYQWKGLRLLLGVMLPSAVPHILGVLRITLAISLILVVMSEMLVGGDGLGMRIVEKERTFDFSGLYAETFLLGTIGIVLNLLLGTISRSIYYWRSDTDWRKSR